VQATIGLLALAAIAAFVGARLLGSGLTPAATPSATTAVVGPGPAETPVVLETAAPSAPLPSPELTPAPETLPPDTPPPTAGATETPTVGPTEAASRTYKVKKGDTLFAIAQRFDTTVTALIKLNKIKDAALIHAGLVLKIP
jgi:LysM repeat protein